MASIFHHGLVPLPLAITFFHRGFSFTHILYHLPFSHWLARRLHFAICASYLSPLGPSPFPLHTPPRLLASSLASLARFTVHSHSSPALTTRSVVFVLTFSPPALFPSLQLCFTHFVSFHSICTHATVRAGLVLHATLWCFLGFILHFHHRDHHIHSLRCASTRKSTSSDSSWLLPI